MNQIYDTRRAGGGAGAGEQLFNLTYLVQKLLGDG